MSFFDIVPHTEACEVGAAKFRVRGIPINMLFELCKSSPDFVAKMKETRSLPSQELMLICFEHVVSIIGEGVMAEYDKAKDGSRDEFRAKAEEFAAGLPTDAQIAIFSKIWKATMPDGPDPLARMIAEAFGVQLTAPKPTPSSPN
jgi:hypothetical protein